MRTKTIKKEIEFDDSLDQQIRLNEIQRSLALDCASYFINESSERLRLNSDLPYSPVIVAVHAFIAHREWLHYVDRDRLLSVTDSLNEIKAAICKLSESMKDIANSVDRVAVKSPDLWMTSELAAIDKAKEIGLGIEPEWSAADLRYKLHQAIYGGDNG